MADVDGTVRLCCLARRPVAGVDPQHALIAAGDSLYLQKVRDRMLAGEVVEDCLNCHYEELVGIRSRRQRENSKWHAMRDATASSCASTNLVSLDLRLGNVCNLECVMCGAHESSRWEKVERQLRPASSLGKRCVHADAVSTASQRTEALFGSRFMEDFSSLLPSLRELTLGGGEPLLSPAHQKLLETCVRSNHARHIHLYYHTNGTMAPSWLSDYWRQFAGVDVFLSVDAVGERNHYIRYPTDWTRVNNNILKFYDLGVRRLVVVTTVQFLNLLVLPELFTWVRGLRAATQGFVADAPVFNLLHFPEFLNVRIFPQHLRSEVRTRVLDRCGDSASRHFASAALAFMDATPCDVSLLATAAQFISGLDQRRKTSFRQTFPELVALVGDPQLKEWEIAK
jgi:hypothetical protein